MTTASTLRAGAPSTTGFWVLDVAVRDGTLERLADARALADRAGERVGALLVGACQGDSQRLIRHGADHVCLVPASPCGRAAWPGQNTVVAAAAKVLAAAQPRVVFAAGDGFGRECACRLAARTGWRLVSPALMVRFDNDVLVASALDPTGKWARQVAIEPGQTAVVTLRPGVAEAMPADDRRTGTVEVLTLPAEPENVMERRALPADPATADIRHLQRLVAGGRGLGGPQGFTVLHRVAEKLSAGVAASRVAVDLGWIEHDRQVGQTGKSVKPLLYLACGISGASHHLEGMSESTHVVAVNTDPRAPIFKMAHLGLVADLFQVLDHLERGLAG